MIELLVGVAGVLVAILALLSFLAKSKESKAEDDAPRGIPNAAREVGPESKWLILRERENEKARERESAVA